MYVGKIYSFGVAHEATSFALARVKSCFVVDNFGFRINLLILGQDFFPIFLVWGRIILDSMVNIVEITFGVNSKLVLLEENLILRSHFVIFMNYYEILENYCLNSLILTPIFSEIAFRKIFFMIAFLISAFIHYNGFFYLKSSF